MNNLIITFLASFLIWLLFMGLFILWFVDGRIKKEQVIHAILSGLIAYLVTDVIKNTIPTIRPFMLDGQKALTLTVPSDGAFPSSHTALAFSLAVTIFLHDKKVGIIYLLLALLVGIARVIANVHFPIDIIGGAVIGVMVSIFVERVHLFNLLPKPDQTTKRKR